MTLSEFKAWFEGYTEGLDGAPTEKQFKRIKAKVAEITGESINRHVWVDHYRHYYGHPVWNGLTGGNIGCSAGAVAQSATVGNAVLMNLSAKSVAAGGEGTFCSNDAEKLTTFDSHAAMYAVGKIDAQEAA